MWKQYSNSNFVCLNSNSVHPNSNFVRPNSNSVHPNANYVHLNSNSVHLNSNIVYPNSNLNHNVFNTCLKMHEFNQKFQIHTLFKLCINSNFVHIWFKFKLCSNSSPSAIPIELNYQNLSVGASPEVITMAGLATAMSPSPAQCQQDSHLLTNKWQMLRPFQT